MERETKASGTASSLVMEEGVGPAPSVASDAQMEEARLLVRMREAHSKALQMAATKLGPETFEKHVRPIKAQVGGDVDAATLAAKVVTRVVERSEEGFRQLCERMSVNEKLLALERRQVEMSNAAAADDGSEDQQGQAAATDEPAQALLTDGGVRPLPGGRQPSELVREGTMRLKLAERDRLSRLAEEAERSADAEAARAAEIEAALEKRLEEVTATQQALMELWPPAGRSPRTFRERPIPPTAAVTTKTTGPPPAQDGSAGSRRRCGEFSCRTTSARCCR